MAFIDASPCHSPLCSACIFLAPLANRGRIGYVFRSLRASAASDMFVSGCQLHALACVPRPRFSQEPGPQSLKTPSVDMYMSIYTSIHVYICIYNYV